MFCSLAKLSNRWRTDAAISQFLSVLCSDPAFTGLPPAPGNWYPLVERDNLGPWKVRMRHVVLHRGEDGFWVVEVPSLPGCISQGKTKEEALESIRDAIAGYVEALTADNLPVPEDGFDTLVVAV